MSFFSLSLQRVLILFLLTFFSLSAEADRLRHCDGKLEVSLHERDDNLQGYGTSIRTLYSNIKTAGKHGGVRANTARSRARERLKSCVSYWLGDRSNLPIEKQSECDNALVDSGAESDDFLNKTKGDNIAEALIGTSVYGSICNFQHFYNDQVHAKAKLTITGNTNCGSTTEYNLNLGPKYAFCAKAGVFETVPTNYPSGKIKLRNTLDSKALANRLMFAENSLYLFDKVPNGHRNLLFGVDDMLVLGGIAALSAIVVGIESHFLSLPQSDLEQALDGFTEAGQTSFMNQNKVSAWDVVSTFCRGSIDNHNDEHKVRLLVRASRSQCPNGFLFSGDVGNVELSSGGHYLIRESDRTRLWIRSDAHVPPQLVQDTQNGSQVYISHNGVLYFAFLPAQMYMRDCCQTGEDIMAGERLRQGERNSYIYNSGGFGYDLPQDLIPFGDYASPSSTATEAQNYYSSMNNFASSNANLVNNNANPQMGQAYAVVRMSPGSSGEEVYPYHVAAVIGEDEDDRITMEVFATNEDANGYNEAPLFRMYSTRTDRTNLTFHQTWSTRLGNGSITVTLGSLFLYLRNMRGSRP
jgi:hypothetical protein